MLEWLASSHRLATRLSLVALAATLVVSVALTLVAIHALGAAGGSESVHAAAGRQMLGLGLVVSLFASLASYFIAAYLLRPIEELSQAVERIAKGETEVVLPEPRSDDEISLLTRSFRVMNERLLDRARRLEKSQHDVEEVNQQLREQNGELHRVNEVLEQLSITDGLTKLHNHRFFHEHLMREVKRADRSAEPLALILIDIDHFKQWNDHLGHAAGDEILRRVADVMNDLIRETDVLARYGGEEFAVIAPNTDKEGALQLAEKIRSSIAETNFVLAPPSEQRALTVSVGVALYSGDRSSFFNEADRALYAAKEQGRDCVVTADESRT